MNKVKKELMKEEKWTPLHFDIIQKLGSTNGLILTVLIDTESKYNKEQFFISQTEISKLLGFGINTVKRGIKQLTEMGLVSIKDKSYNNTNCYTLDSDKIMNLFKSDMSQNGTNQNGTNQNDTVQNDTAEVPKWDIHSTKMILPKSQNDTAEVPKWDSQEQEYTNNDHKNIKQEYTNKEIKIIHKLFDQLADNKIEYSQRLKIYNNLIEDYKDINNCYDILNFDISQRNNWNRKITEYFINY